MRAVPEKPLVILAVLLLLFSYCASATITIHPGEQIQMAVDSAKPGELIEVYNGIYHENLVVDKPLHLRGISSESGLPQIVTDDSSAIILKGDGIILEGFSAKSLSGWTEDASILVSSDNNILRSNVINDSGNAGMIFINCGNNTISGNFVQGNRNEGIILKNSSYNHLRGNQVSENRFGFKFMNSNDNEIAHNTFSDNRFWGVYFENCQRNIIDGNNFRNNWGGITLEISRNNIIVGNDLMNNDKGIRLSHYNNSNDIMSKGKGVFISYKSGPSKDSVSANNTLYLNNLSNKENAYDEGLDHWDNGILGNNYSDFNEPEKGCIGVKICDSDYRISGGPSIDRFPLANSKRLESLGPSIGLNGAVLRLFKSNFVPGSDLRVNFTTPIGFEAWASLDIGNMTQAKKYLGQNKTGDVIFIAPEQEGSYRLRMRYGNDTEITSVPFNVTWPSISVSPSRVSTCEKINVSFSGASGQNTAWIGMYRAGSSQIFSRQYLTSREKGSIIFSSPVAGSFEFKMFDAEANNPSAASGVVEVDARSGVKVIAEPAIVAPGGTVTVTFWGAPSSGAGVLGMYEITRPDKFHIEKRPIGSMSCGSMTFRLPTTPGNYDFRMFQDDVYRQILAVSNGVTVR